MLVTSLDKSGNRVEEGGANITGHLTSSGGDR